MCNSNFRVKIVKHLEFMLNFYLKDHPASVLYLYFINYTRKTYLLAILIIIVQKWVYISGQALFQI